MPVVAYHDYTVDMLRKLTTPVVKPLGYTYAAAFRVTSDGSITNTANGLQLALHTPSRKLTFVPRVHVGREGSKVCPTRQLVLDTPSHVRSELWELRDGCKLVFHSMGVNKGNPLKQEGTHTRGTMAGCALHKCGGDVPCCVKYMPSSGGAHEHVTATRLDPRTCALCYCCCCCCCRYPEGPGSRRGPGGGFRHILGVRRQGL